MDTTEPRHSPSSEEGSVRDEKAFPLEETSSNVEENAKHVENTSWDKEDHGDDSSGKPDWTVKQVAALISLCMLWVGSQVPLYFVGGSLAYMVKDLGGAQAQAWLPVCYTLVLASICPFVGYLQDLFGRRYMTLGGAVLVMVGTAVVGSAHSFGQGIAGMCIAGAGAAIGELTALAGTSELVPVRKRGLYIGLIVLFIIPFCPYVLYSQLLSTRATWRWTMWISLIYNAIAVTGIALFYFPEKIHSSYTGPKRALLKQVDYMGGFLSISGATLFLVAIQAGGYTYPWANAHVLAPLIIGILLICCFFVWEWKLAKKPLTPRELFQGQRAVAVSFVAAFVGGMNFYSLLNFFPLSFETLFNPPPIQVGLKGLGYGFSVTLGAAFFNVLLTVFKGSIREIMVVSAIIMTAFGGALAAVTPETPRMAVALGTICGFGCGGLLVPPQTIAISCSPDAFIATATALSLCVRVIGGSIGYAIYYAIFSNKLKTELPAKVVAYAVQAGLPASSAVEFVEAFLTDPTALAKVQGVTPAVIAAATKGSQWAYADGMRLVWLTSIPFGVCAILACCFLGNTKAFMTNRIAAHIRH